MTATHILETLAEEFSSKPEHVQNALTMLDAGLSAPFIGRFRRSYRFVEEGEHLRARDIDQRASGHLSLKGDVATVQAGLVVKVDGAQVHLG